MRAVCARAAHRTTCRQLLKEAGLASSTYYYRPKLPQKDEQLKLNIERVLNLHPSYGYRRLSLALSVNGKRIRRVMKLFGIQPYRRRGRKPKPRLTSSALAPFPNLIKGWFPSCPAVVWVSDFTYIPFQGSFCYLATIVDLFSRELVGYSFGTRRGASLVARALFDALETQPAPQILHMDQGTEYRSKAYLELAQRFGIQISMSRAGSPWENGYQEGFYSAFKVDFGDPHRFETTGELVEAVHLTAWVYNTHRIHGALKMPPLRYLAECTNVSRKRGA